MHSLCLRIDWFIVSGIHNSNKLTLQWEESNPVLMSPNLHMSEFIISYMWTNTSEKTDFYSTDDYELRYSCKCNYCNYYKNNYHIYTCIGHSYFTQNSSQK